MKQKTREKSRKSKSKKYSCKLCDYFTSKKSDLVKHRGTRKHKMKQHEIENLDFLAAHKYVCEHCNEFFKSRTTVWRHKKKCVFNPKNKEDENTDSLQKNNEILEKKQIVKEKKQIVNEKKQIVNEKIDNKNIEILLSKLEKKDKQNEELWKAFHEQHELLKQTIQQNSDIIPRIGNNNNNNISINVILNEKCKNAINLEDFLKNLQVSLDDLMYTKENGYVKGLSNIMAKHLKDMQPNDRPIHCSDQNKLQFYVKEENIWEKDEKNNKVNKSINEIQRKQVLKIKEWTDSHPNYCEDNDLYIEYQKLVKSTMCVNNQDNTDIKKNISDIINIDDVVIN